MSGARLAETDGKPLLPHAILPASGLNAKALFKRDAADSSHETVVAGARAVHLPTTPPARSADPHTT
jgi:hypothetical protein